jgi:hypothetical protein
MTLLLRPTKLASTAHARLRDWAIVEDGRTVGRIVKDGSASTPPHRRWSWSIVIFVSDRTGIVTSGRASTLSEAKADFRRNWERVPALGAEARLPVTENGALGRAPPSQTQVRGPE